jgi:hypothetical protein
MHVVVQTSMDRRRFVVFLLLVVGSVNLATSSGIAEGLYHAFDAIVVILRRWPRTRQNESATFFYFVAFDKDTE